VVHSEILEVQVLHLLLVQGSLNTTSATIDVVSKFINAQTSRDEGFACNTVIRSQYY
jgi:hypothetical protein